VIHEIGHGIDHVLTGALYHDGYTRLGAEFYSKVGGHSNYGKGKTCMRASACSSWRETWADAFAMFVVYETGALRANWQMSWLVNEGFFLSDSLNKYNDPTDYFMSHSAIANVYEGVAKSLITAYGQ
jgi:hypothetical protein